MLGDFITRFLVYVHVAPIYILIDVYLRSCTSFFVIANLIWLITHNWVLELKALCVFLGGVPGWFLGMHILHLSVTKLWRRTGSRSKNCGFGANIGNKHFLFYIINLVLRILIGGWFVIVFWNWSVLEDLPQFNLICLVLRNINNLGMSNVLPPRNTYGLGEMTHFVPRSTYYRT